MRDPWPGEAARPSSLHAYQYALGNPVLLTDPSGPCAAWGNTECALVRTWDEVAALFPYAYRTALPAAAQAAARNGRPPGPREVAEWAAWDSVIRAQPWRYALDRRPFQSAQIFSEYFLGRNILRELDSDLAALQAERDELQQLGTPRRRRQRGCASSWR